MIFLECLLQCRFCHKRFTKSNKFDLFFNLFMYIFKVAFEEENFTKLLVKCRGIYPISCQPNLKSSHFEKIGFFIILERKLYFFFRIEFSDTVKPLQFMGKSNTAVFQISEKTLFASTLRNYIKD